LLEETGVPGENHRPLTSHWQTLSHDLVSSTPRHEQDGFELTTILVIGTDWTGSCKSNYHTINPLIILLSFHHTHHYERLTMNVSCITTRGLQWMYHVSLREAYNECIVYHYERLTMNVSCITTRDLQWMYHVSLREIYNECIMYRQ
jgi:hypothetical protein